MIMAVELTPRVAQDTGGFGFQVPVFRMNQGISAATANPMSRAAMQPMEMISEAQFGLNPNVLAMADESARAQFFAGVDELNQFVNKAAEFGIDPSKVDMSVPESFALNQEFRKRVQALQQQARGITTGAAQIAAAERAENLAFEQQKRLDYATDREEKRLEKGFLKEISGLTSEIDDIMKEQGQKYSAAQSASFENQRAGLIKKLKAKREELMTSKMDQPNNVYKLQRLDETIQQVAGVMTRPEDPRNDYLPPSQPTSLSEIPITAYKENNPPGPLLNPEKQLISGTPTITGYEEGAYYVKDGKQIPTYDGDPALRNQAIRETVERGVIGNGYIEVKPMSQAEYIEAMTKITKNNTGDTEASAAAKAAQIEALNKERERRRKGGTIQVKVVVPEKTAIAKVRTSPAVAPTKGQAREGAEAKRIVNPQTKGQASKGVKETKRFNLDKSLGLN